MGKLKMEDQKMQNQNQKTSVGGKCGTGNGEPKGVINKFCGKSDHSASEKFVMVRCGPMRYLVTLHFPVFHFLVLHFQFIRFPNLLNGLIIIIKIIIIIIMHE